MIPASRSTILQGPALREHPLASLAHRVLTPPQRLPHHLWPCPLPSFPVLKTMNNSSPNLTMQPALLFLVPPQPLFTHRIQPRRPQPGSFPLVRYLRRTTVHNTTTMQPRTNMVRSLQDLNVEQIPLAGHIMLITIHAPPHGIGHLPTKLPIFTLWKAKQMRHGNNTIAVSLWTTC